MEHFSWDHNEPDGRKGREVVLNLGSGGEDCDGAGLRDRGFAGSD
jgi:hypothetical protein